MIEKIASGQKKLDDLDQYYKKYEKEKDGKKKSDLKEKIIKQEEKIKQNSGITSLALAIVLNNETRLKEILKEEPNQVNQQTPHPSFKYRNADDRFLPPLQLAIQCNHIDIVELLIDFGADVNQIGEQGYPSLIAAITHLYEAPLNQMKVVKLLLSKKADVNLQDNFGYLPISTAAVQGNVKLVKILIDNGAVVKGDCISQESSPLLIAIERSGSSVEEPTAHEEIVKLLLDAGADHNAQDKEITALFLAVARENVRVVLMLKQADPNVAHLDGTTPLLHAVKLYYSKQKEQTSDLLKSNRLKLIEILLDAKADPNIANDKKESPLFVTVNRGDTFLINKLRNAPIKAKINTKTPDGGPLLLPLILYKMNQMAYNWAINKEMDFVDEVCKNNTKYQLFTYAASHENIEMLSSLFLIWDYHIKCAVDSKQDEIVAKLICFMYEDLGHAFRYAIRIRNESMIISIFNRVIERDMMLSIWPLISETIANSFVEDLTNRRISQEEFNFFYKDLTFLETETGDTLSKKMEKILDYLVPHYKISDRNPDVNSGEDANKQIEGPSPDNEEYISTSQKEKAEKLERHLKSKEIYGKQDKPEIESKANKKKKKDKKNKKNKKKKVFAKDPAMSLDQQPPASIPASTTSQTVVEKKQLIASNLNENATKKSLNWATFFSKNISQEFSSNSSHTNTEISFLRLFRDELKKLFDLSNYILSIVGNKEKLAANIDEIIVFHFKIIGDCEQQISIISNLYNDLTLNKNIDVYQALNLGENELYKEDAQIFFFLQRIESWVNPVLQSEFIVDKMDFLRKEVQNIFTLVFECRECFKDFPWEKNSSFTSDPTQYNTSSSGSSLSPS